MEKDPVSNKQIKLFLIKSQKNEESITFSINNTTIDIYMQKNELGCTPNITQKGNHSRPWTSQPKTIQLLEENIVKKISRSNTKSTIQKRKTLLRLTSKDILRV